MSEDLKGEGTGERRKSKEEKGTEDRTKETLRLRKEKVM